MFSHWAPRRQRGFTLLELMTVMLIISILTVLLVPVISDVQKRLERTRCMANMRNLHVAASLYLNDRRTWPRVITPGASGTPENARKWIAILEPYEIRQINWICPTIQSKFGAPDLTKPENARIDYRATPFDAHPMTPYKWPTQPWFIENGNVHGHGALVIFPDGHVEDAYDIIARSGGSKVKTP
jgi:prepilin-type N-terminal cleavage/methylation domain-containing protein